MPAPFIVLAGLDGSGKSTVLAHIQRYPWPGIKAVYIGHRRPGVLYPVPPQDVGEEQEVTHYSKPNHGAVRSVAKMGVMALDWLVGYWAKLRPLRRQQTLVVFDRHYLFDIGIDPHRYRYGGPLWAVRGMQKLVPAPSAVIFLDVTEEVSQARKQEQGAHNFAEQRAAYLAQAKQSPHWHVVDAAQPLAAVLTQVEKIISDLL
ncbi:MAG: hypothetical protein OT477_06655 [Chloroflexi bacterium]|nr:hypothetical protein [Chloroflexota bacterium]